jgi:hypothetical protein
MTLALSELKLLGFLGKSVRYCLDFLGNPFVNCLEIVDLLTLGLSVVNCWLFSLLCKSNRTNVGLHVIAKTSAMMESTKKWNPIL